MSKVWFDPKKGEFPKIKKGSYGVDKWTEYQQEDIYQIPIEEHRYIRVYALLEDPSTPVLVDYYEEGKFMDSIIEDLPNSYKPKLIDVSDMILRWRYLPKPPKDVL